MTGVEKSYNCCETRFWVVEISGRDQSKQKPENGQSRPMPENAE